MIWFIQLKIWLQSVDFYFFIKTTLFWFFLKKNDPDDPVKTQNLDLGPNRV